MSSNDDESRDEDVVQNGVARARSADNDEEENEHSNHHRPEQETMQRETVVDDVTESRQTMLEEFDTEEEDVKMGIAPAATSDDSDSDVDDNDRRGRSNMGRLARWDLVDAFHAFLESVQDGDIKVGGGMRATTDDGGDRVNVARRAPEHDGNVVAEGNNNNESDSPLHNRGETMEVPQSSQGASHDIESAQGVARIELSDILSLSTNAKGTFAAATSSSNGGRRGGRQRAMVPGAEYVRRRAPGIAPSSYIERARGAIRSRTPSEEEETPSLPTVTASVSIVHEPAESVLLPALKLRESRRWLNALTTLAALSVIAAIVAVSVLVVHNKNKHGKGNTTRFSPFTMDCGALKGQTHPNFLTQCRCTGTIYNVPSDVAVRYDDLTYSFIPTLLPDFFETMNSCSPRNQALVWLASGDGMPTEADMRQRYILALLFVAWSGPTWLASDGWLTADDECSWMGVSCEGSNDVDGINLPNKNLTGNIISEIAFLTSLTKLSLSQNNVQGTLPTQLVSLLSLQELSLAFNFISGRIPSDYGKMTELTTLILSDNHLRGTLPSELGLISGLRELRVSNNRINGTIPAVFGRLEHLQAIALDNNTLIGKVPTEIGLWKQATQIDFGFNDFRQSTIPSEIGQLANLRSITLTACSLRGTLPKELFGILGLQTIDVTANHLQGTISAMLGQLSALNTLSLGQNYFTDSIPNDIGNCTSLNQMFVDGNSLNGTIPSELGRLPLATLDLIGNNFTGSVPIEVCASVTPLFCYHGYRTTLRCNCCNCPGGAFQ